MAKVHSTAKWCNGRVQAIRNVSCDQNFSPHLLDHIWWLHRREGFGGRWWRLRGYLLWLLDRAGRGHLLLAAEGVLLVVHYRAADRVFLLLIEQAAVLLKGRCLESSLLERSPNAANLISLLLGEARQLLLHLAFQGRVLLNIWKADSGASLLEKVSLVLVRWIAVFCLGLTFGGKSSLFVDMWSLWNVLCVTAYCVQPSKKNLGMGQGVPHGLVTWTRSPCWQCKHF